MTCPLCITVKTACCRSVFTIIVCQGVQTASTDVFVTNRVVEAVNRD